VKNKTYLIRFKDADHLRSAFEMLNGIKERVRWETIGFPLKGLKGKPLVSL